MADKRDKPQSSFTPTDMLDAFDAAARSVTDLKDGSDKRVDHILDLAVLAIRGETLAWCEKQGPMALEMFKQRYRAILCIAGKVVEEKP